MDAQGWLEHGQMFIDDLTKDIKNIFEACAQNTNPRAKPKSLDSRSDLIYQPTFTNFL